MKASYLSVFAMIGAASAISGWLEIKASLPSCMLPKDDGRTSGLPVKLYKGCTSKTPTHTCCNYGEDNTQRWDYSFPVSNKTKVKPHNSNLCLDAGPSSGWKNGALLHVTPCTENPTSHGQLWSWGPITGADTALVLADTNFCTDFKDGKFDSTGAGDMQMWQCDRSNVNQVVIQAEQRLDNPNL